MPDPYPQYQLRSERGATSGYPSLDGTGKIPVAQIPILAHGSLSDLDLDQHPQYQLRDEKGATDGYAPLDTIGVVPDVHLPDTLVRLLDLAAHEAAADPHPGYQLRDEKGVANGYASLDAAGIVPEAQLPGSFYGWNSFATGTLPTSAGAIYTVPAGKIANVVFISIKNNSATTQSVDIFVHKDGDSPVSIGTVELLEQEYAWYLEGGIDSLSLLENDAIEAITTTGSVVEFALLGSLKDA